MNILILIVVFLLVALVHEGIHELPKRAEHGHTIEEHADLRGQPVRSNVGDVTDITDADSAIEIII